MLVVPEPDSLSLVRSPVVGPHAPHNNEPINAVRTFTPHRLMKHIGTRTAAAGDSDEPPAPEPATYSAQRRSICGRLDSG